ncbi:Uncharacterised protein [Mycobacterium tuberculosis]|nr:Uncharacterised protein [Mycobacterium tuberculosis]
MQLRMVGGCSKPMQKATGSMSCTSSITEMILAVIRLVSLVVWRRQLNTDQSAATEN